MSIEPTLKTANEQLNNTPVNSNDEKLRSGGVPSHRGYPGAPGPSNTLQEQIAYAQVRQDYDLYRRGVHVKPLGSKVFVKIFKGENISKGGIVLPETHEDKSQIGTVVAVGPGKVLESGHFIPLAVRPDEKVVFNRYAGTRLEVKGEEYVVLAEFEIHCVLLEEVQPREDAEKFKEGMPLDPNPEVSAAKSLHSVAEQGRYVTDKSDPENQ